VCGLECYSRLECLVRALQHELCHLIVFTNWLDYEDAHDINFKAVASCFFGHKACTHGLPIPLSVVINKTKQNAGRGESCRCKAEIKDVDCIPQQKQKSSFRWPLSQTLASMMAEELVDSWFAE
jgi:predicted SprT family Zn-dependent metalloprotease